MEELAAYSTVTVTLGLVITRPRVGLRFRLSAAHAACLGALVLLLLGIVRPAHFASAGTELWSPFVALASIMVMTEVARRVGLLDSWAARIEDRATSTHRLFALVFALGVVTSTALNNDAAILLLTPVVVSLVMRRYPGQPHMIEPFVFAVFMSAGVAALPVSNPMNIGGRPVHRDRVQRVCGPHGACRVRRGVSPSSSFGAPSGERSRRLSLAGLPMSLLNMMALDAATPDGRVKVFAALVGGDIGPRVFPMGSLAGLLWFEALRRQMIHIRLLQFVTIGLWTAIPTIALSLALLAAFTR